VKLGVIKVMLGVMLMGVLFPVSAQDVTPSQTPSSSPLTDLGSDYHNSIILLQNRFRIDHNVEEVTMIFFRQYGSAPVVLVRPDGSKLFQRLVDDEKVKWFDSDTYDMITIKNPVPGPWQAVGQVLPGSRIMVLTDLELHVSPLPSILFSGEILKATANLTNDGKPIENNRFRDVVELTIEFISTNNPNFDNFGSNDEEIASFEDNGQGMDERPLDGIFTGQFNLSIAPGEWRPVYQVKTPMYSREQRGGIIELHANPITIDAEVDVEGGNEGYHRLLIDVNRELVNIESLLVDGTIKYPNGDIQHFSLTEGGTEAREYLIVAFEKGIFRVKVTAYGESVEGRDFILDVPEFTFLADDPTPDVIDPLIDGKDPLIDGTEGLLLIEGEIEADVTPTEEESEASGNVMWLVIAVNGTILVLGLVAAVIIIMKRRPSSGTSTLGAKNKLGTEASSSEADLSIENKPKGFKKLLSKFKK